MTPTDDMERRAVEKKPFWVKCGPCGHCWTAGYVPMEAAMFAKISMNASKNCPMCGSSKVFVAKQNDGVLQEGDYEGVSATVTERARTRGEG